MKYWFYLEPYTFLFRNENEAVVYNTLNGAYITCPQHPVIEEILNNWDDASKGYGTILDGGVLKDEGIIKQFVIDVRETFSGDCVEYDEERVAPYLFKPTLFLNSDIRTREEKEKTSLGEHVLQNLNEVTLHLPSTCSKQCIKCSAYHRQMNHCTLISKGELQRVDYECILHLFQLIGVQRVNFSAGGNPISNSNIIHYLNKFLDSSFKKHLWLDYTFFSEQYLELATATCSILDIFVHSDDWNEQLAKYMKKDTEGQICWHLIVSNEAEMGGVEALNIPVNTHFNIHPFYTEENLDFFREYVFIGMEDILADPVDRQTIFRRQSLDDNFFGKLTIFPSGEVHSNVNFPSLGNIQNSSLKELVYKELTEGYSWLKVRGNEIPCSQCINKSLCPSISNYELVIGRNNLCKIKSE
ncbi:TIGR04150 pseudo-rSAM protein [Bacteroides sp.]